ncbi:polyphosphate kinase 2, partial [Pseudomonas citronellolis]|nr:polyphosphate kinase 2 [Pseudomonas citronellolis]
MSLSNDNLIRRIHRELLDHSDEELELELLEDVRNIDELFDAHIPDGDEEKIARRRYFSELFRLQGELVKLQSWVVKTGHKVVILFEGRDAAGKGGV